MKSLVRFWNLIHYCVYEIQLIIHNFLSLLNPVSYFLRIPAIKRGFKNKRGIDNISDYVDKSAFNNPKSGVPITWAGILMGVLTINIELLLFNMIQIILKKNLLNYVLDNGNYGLIFILSLLIPGIVLDHFVLFKGKRYLIYFEEFDRIPRIKIKFYCLICLVAFLSVFALLIYSFTFFHGMDNRG